jgi:hypothetical protein
MICNRQVENVFEHRRPRFWYFVLSTSDCSPIDGINFSVEMQNVLSGSWEIEFGVNEQGNVTHHFLRIHFAGSERFDYMLRAGV